MCILKKKINENKYLKLALTNENKWKKIWRTMAQNKRSYYVKN